MNTYFEAINSRGKVVIDDSFRYLYEIGVLDLSTGSSAPSVISSRSYRYDSKRRFTILKFNKFEEWQYLQGSPFMNNSSYPRYMSYIKQVNPNRLYGIRFKKKSINPKIYVRAFHTVLGSAITNNPNVSSLLIEVLSSDATTDINTVNAYQDYFEIVEIGNTEVDGIPVGYGGAEIYNADGERIWASTCKMINVESVYSGDLGGTYTYSAFDENHIVIPNRVYRRSYLQFSDGNFTHSGYQYRDYYTYNDNGLVNEVLVLRGRSGDQYDEGAVWDGRDFGADSSTPKIIAGIIAT